jgi:hypothetical protein
VIVLWSLPYKSFELDRFFVPKELVLHLVAGVAALLLLVRSPRLSLNRIDTLLGAFVALSAVSAVFATNGWLAMRAVGVSLSSLVVFLVARSLAERGHARAILGAMAGAVVAGALTGLLQAYGIEGEWMSLSRAPGGTFGNRNFMAHLAAIGTPTLVLLTLTARSPRQFNLGLTGIGLVAAALVLSRTRAAWLALMVCSVVALAMLFVVRGLWRDARVVRRTATMAVAIGIGALAALALPNELDWRSDSPYLDSVKGVVNFREGSGAGRLVQYRRSAVMTLSHPVLGVGPGNWSVRYPEYAARNDPSLSQQDGMTSNPWPSSDWVAWLSERGPLAVGILLLAFLGAFLAAAGSGAHAEDSETKLRALALGATIAVACVVAAFDAVMLLAVPALFVWALLGALLPPMREKRRFEGSQSRLVVVAAGVLCLAAATRSGLQAAAMGTFDGSSRNAAWERAASLDPGSYRIRIRLAAAYARRRDCTHVREHAGAARELFPTAGEPKRLLRGCGVRK